MSDHMRTVQMKIDYIMEQVLDRAYAQIMDQIYDEDYSKDDAWAALHNWELEDHFADWWDEGEE